MELTEEEKSLILKRRSINRETIVPAGIGTGRIWARAKLLRKKFIDEVTFIERDGKDGI